MKASDNSLPVVLDLAATAGNANGDFAAVGGNKRHEVLYGQITLVCDATVANRQFRFQILDNAGTLVFDTHAGAVATAGLTVHFELMRGIFREGAIVAGSVQVPIPDKCIMGPGWKIRCNISSGGQAGDSFSGKIVVDESAHR